MAKANQDPIQDIKAFLSRSDRRSMEPVALTPIVPQLREVYRRYDKARQLHPGVGMSEAVSRLSAGGK